MVNRLSPATWWNSTKSFVQRGFSRKTDPSYGITSQFYTPGQPIYSDRNYHSFVVEGYKKCGPVYACVNKISGGAAGIKWKLYTDQSMKREIPSHPLLDLWNRPNPRMGASELVEQIFGFWHMAGNSYLYASRLNPKEPPVELWPLFPDKMQVVAGQYDIQGYVYGYGSTSPRIYELEDIMHLKFASYDDRTPYYGLSPIEVAMRTVDRLNAGNDWNTALMQNDGRPSSVFTSKNYLTVDQRNQVKSELRKKYSGKRNAGMPMVLEADLSWQQVAIPPKELDWLESRGIDERGICMILDVPSILLSDYEGQTYANRKEAKQSLFTENILPKMDRVVGHVNMWLVPMYEDLKRMGAYFSYDPKDIEVLAELYAAAEQSLAEKATNMFNNGTCSLRYAQELQGVPAKPGVYLDVYKMGPNTLVREADLEAYAIACLEKLSASPPIPMLHQAAPTQLPPPSPHGQTTVTEVDDKPAPDEEQPDPDEKQPAKMQSVSPLVRPASRYRHQDGRPLRSGVKIIDLTSKEDKAAYMAQVEQQRVTWEAEVAPRLQDYFKAEHKAVIAAINASSATSHVDQSVQDALVGEQDALQTLIYNIWHDVGEDFGEKAVREFAAADTESKAADDLISIFNRQTIAYLLSLAATKVSQIDATTLEALRQALADGVQAGEGIPDIAKRIDQLYLKEIIPNRSEAIAQTEVVAASNWASNEAAQQSGLDLEAVWLATEDNRTRPAHAEADGQTVPLGQPFEVDGEQLQYPGDPAGSAKNVIRCRCTQFYQRVQSASTSEEKRKVITLPVRSYSSMRAFLEAVL